MPVQTTIRLLYLGRRPTLVQEIESAWQRLRSAEQALAPFTLNPLAVNSQSSAHDALRVHSFHAILLDVDNQRQDRTRFCQGLRRRYPQLLIAAACTEQPKSAHFIFDHTVRLPVRQKNAEDFLRQISQRGTEIELRFGRIQLNLATRTVRGPRGSHLLPPKQCALLRILLLNGGEIISRETIMRSVWETDFLADTRTLDVHIRWLREKIEPEPSRPVHLLTIRGKGFQLVAG